MKKILVITYYWPPSGGSGVQRWMYFSKYLSQFGFTPIVLTVSEEKASYPYTDKSLLEHIKNIKTIKTGTFEPLKLYSFLTSGNSKKGIPQGHLGTVKKGFFFKLFTFIRVNFFIPDARVGWNRFALKHAVKIIDSEKIEVVITTGPPHSTHLIGLKLKRRFNIKWVADFRDPWTDAYYYEELKRMKFAQKKDEFYERETLANADGILTIGYNLMKLLSQKNPNQTKKFHFVYNGYDSDLMDAIRAPTSDGFEITFIGVLTHNQPYKSLIESLKIFIMDTGDIDDVSLNVAGNVEKIVIEEIKRELPELRINYYGYVSQIESLKLMKRSQLLLNCLAETVASHVMISGKQMEYIATGNPILCFGDIKGESAFILSDIQNARTFEKSDVEAAAQFISLVYSKWRNNESYKNDVGRPNVIDKSRIATSRRLSEILQKIVQ